MRIVMATDTYWPRMNGVTVVVDMVRRQLTQLGHAVYVFAPEYPSSDRGGPRCSEDGVYRFPSFAVLVSPEDRIGQPGTRRKMARVLDELRPHLVHTHSEFVVGTGCAAYCRQNAVPHVATCHTYWEKYLSTYFPFVPAGVARLIVAGTLRRLFRSVDRLTVPSRFMETLMRSYGVQCPIDVIPNGIIPEDFVLQEEEQSALALHFARVVPEIGSRRVLLYVGRIAREKNVDLLLEAMQRIVSAAPEVLLLLAGSGPHHLALESRARHSGLAGHVRFLGYLSHKQLSYLYRKAEALLFTSMTDTQGLVLVEAMSCGTPVVAVRAPATEEILGEGRGGLLVEQDVSRFVQAALLLLHDPRARRRKSEEARVEARKWTAERLASRLLGVYEQAIRSRRPSQAPGALGSGQLGS
jgi:1,2-diacylglycerol 3-alpha-glucosyltransferase